MTKGMRHNVCTVDQTALSRKIFARTIIIVLLGGLGETNLALANSRTGHYVCSLVSQVSVYNDHVTIHDRHGFQLIPYDGRATYSSDAALPLVIVEFHISDSGVTMINQANDVLREFTKLNDHYYVNPTDCDRCSLNFLTPLPPLVYIMNQNKFSLSRETYQCAR